MADYLTDEEYGALLDIYTSTPMEKRFVYLKTFLTSEVHYELWRRKYIRVDAAKVATLHPRSVRLIRKREGLPRHGG